MLRLLVKYTFRRVSRSILEIINLGSVLITDLLELRGITPKGDYKRKYLIVNLLTVSKG